ncbi:uncharacterized protein si:ch211-244b2.4 [Scyliorhinus canicula]|uniref:uncharacterized protein si:ch211-244b2.4 n=1 Tax=Scyliorhinus canicula TaxID=7830 RepID=UPI0018F3AEAC|nr:uncharacterized protein si:ch211-244b2.4 [Scyliorhinus canicula]
MASRLEPGDKEDSYSDDSIYSDYGDDNHEGASGSDTDISAEGQFNEGRFKKNRTERTGLIPCKYYNEHICKNKNCTYLHVCKYYINGNCKYGRSCRLSHSMHSDTESPESSDEATPQRRKRQSAGKQYQWQIKDRIGWNDIDCDHVIEAQYSMPEKKGIKLYNSAYGMISIDFNKMQVHGKDLQVQRKTVANSPKDEWLWYYRCEHKWKQFSAKSKTMRNADIESEYQLDRRKTIPITRNHKSYEICFRRMMQINTVTGSKKRLKRRPKFQGKMKARCSLSDPMSHLNLYGQHQQYRWQFSGNNGNWYDYKIRSGTGTECSVTSEDIESEYLRSTSGYMTFYVNNDQFKLDFQAMMQTNLYTGATRSVQRLALFPEATP